LVFWFFNSSFWGFSRIKINPKGVWLNYGILSIAKNIRLPLSSKWSLDTVYSGFPKKQKLYYIKIDGRKSMRVTVLGLKKLKKIGSNLQRYQQK
jgi:hypothetical protein